MPRCLAQSIGPRRTQEMGRIKVEVAGVLPLLAGVGEVMETISIVIGKLEAISCGGGVVSSGRHGW